MCGRYQFTAEQCEEIRQIAEAIQRKYGASAWMPGEIRPPNHAPVLLDGAGGPVPKLMKWGYQLPGTLVINALRYTKHISHFTVEEAIAVSRRIAPRRTYLTHMSHQIGPYEKVHGTLPEGIEFAWDGLKIDIND